MKKVISTEKKPIKLWLDDIEDGALEQAKNLANLPFVHKHIAIMADSHFGKGCPIGSVVATKGVVVPNIVGCDVSCGVCAVKTSLTDIDTDTLKKIMGEIRKVVPVGFSHHKKAQNIELMPLSEEVKETFLTDEDTGNPIAKGLDDLPIVRKEFLSALRQIGTLGGGNHFQEIQKGDDGHIWIMIHSGSRNLGLKVANHYNKLAQKLNEKWHSSVPKKWDLAFLPIDSEEGQAYIREMNYCVDFALANRKLMMDRIINIFKRIFAKPSGKFSVYKYFDDVYEKTIAKERTKEEAEEIRNEANGEYGYDYTSYEIKEEYKSIVKFDEMINIGHNFAKIENHFGINCMVHRKGATLATKDTIGIIPGSMGSPSYITKGLGNPDSFSSSPHGAGRAMSRKRAKEELSLENEMKILNDQGIVHGIRNKEDLDEATGSYKNIDEVMENSKDLVEILVKLEPIASIKG